MASYDTKEKIKIKHELAPPNMWNVIYINDDKTTMEFVVMSLMTEFGHTEESAYGITMHIHEKGSAIVATMPYEIAEEKGVAVTLLARSHGFPLQVKIEEDKQ